MLTSVVDLPPTAETTVRLNAKKIAVGPIGFPQYLDRAQIVTRTSRHQLNLAEFDRWAEPLKERFPRVLAENLATLLATDQVYILPWRGEIAIDYRVAMDVLEFDTSTDGQVSLIARWGIFDAEGNDIVALRRSVITRKVQGEGYAAVAQGLSQALAKLSQEIAQAIRANG